MIKGTANKNQNDSMHWKSQNMELNYFFLSVFVSTQRMNWRQFLFFFPQSMREIKHTHSERDRAATETSLFVDNKFITAWRVKFRSIFSLFFPNRVPSSNG